MGRSPPGSPQLFADLSYKQEPSGHLQPRPPSRQERGTGGLRSWQTGVDEASWFRLCAHRCLCARPPSPCHAC